MEVYKKYHVTKIEGITDPTAEYFVLRIDKDGAARKALSTYATAVGKTDHEFKMSILEILRKTHRRYKQLVGQGLANFTGGKTNG